MKKRKIAILTGGRFDYGILKPVLKGIENSHELKLELVVSGMHFSNRYGYTLNMIRKDGFDVTAKADIVVPEKTHGKVSIEIGSGVLKLTKIFTRIKPDLVAVLGDRNEALACAIAASFIPIPIAHIHGGDISSGGFDESIRHAITKLAHIHFAATEKSRSRILQMGENPKNVFLVGAPGLDGLLSEKKVSKKELEKKLKVKLKEKTIIVLNHPVSTTPTLAKVQMKTILEAIKDIQATKILIYPNGDVGSEGIIEEIERFRQIEDFVVFRNIDRNLYANILAGACMFIGNSSSGIIETASFGLPTINLGIRQFGRERNENVLDLNYDQNKIRAVVINIIKNNVRFNRRNLYGDGKAAKRIVSELGKIHLNFELLQKHFYEKN